MPKIKLKEGSITKNTQKQIIPIQETFQSFLNHCEVKNLSPASIFFYKETSSMFFKNLKKDSIDEITIEDIEDYILFEKQKGIKVTTINTRLRAIRVFLNYCMEKGYLKSFKISFLKVSEEQKEPYTDEDLTKLLKKPSSNRWVEWRNWAIINYLISTGNRASTVINVKIADINFDNNTIILRHTKNRKIQAIPISTHLCNALKLYLSLWDYEEDGYLFPSSTGKQLALSGLQNAVALYNSNRGVKKRSLHLFRHTYAKHYITNGGNIAYLQMLMGHSSINMTRKYVNLYVTDLANGYDELNPLDNLSKKK